jgi:hydroxymethylpyrimidine pyrophosphatase-like HAD family hydrolase
MQDVVAFGDNYNDLSMLEAAGTGVAMGNAVEVKARANVVIGDNEPPASPTLSTAPAVIRR